MQAFKTFAFPHRHRRLVPVLGRVHGNRHRPPADAGDPAGDRRPPSPGVVVWRLLFLQRCRARPVPEALVGEEVGGEGGEVAGVSQQGALVQAAAEA